MDYFIELVPYLFQNLLFPEGGLNKFKSAANRKEAYELVYKICAASGSNKEGKNGLELLFNSGFRKVYKSTAASKTTSSYHYYPYYYYFSFN